MERKYAEFVQAEARKHVQKQIALRRLRKQDEDDHVQTLVQYVVEQWPRYAADRCSREGFIVQIVSTRVHSLSRKCNALCRTPLREGQLQDWYQQDVLATDVDSIDHVQQRLDMAAAIGCLTDAEANFIKLIADGNLVSAAKKLGMTRPKARGFLARVRTKMVEAGIDNRRWKSPRRESAA